MAHDLPATYTPLGRVLSSRSATCARHALLCRRQSALAHASQQ